MDSSKDISVQYTPVRLVNQEDATGGASSTSGFVQSVATSGTRVQLTAGACKFGCYVTARRGNTGSVYLGGSDVSNAVYGFDLLQGERVWIPVSNTNLLYIDAANNGDGVSVQRC